MFSQNNMKTQRLLLLHLNILIFLALGNEDPFSAIVFLEFWAM